MTKRFLDLDCDETDLSKDGTVGTNCVKKKTVTCLKLLKLKRGIKDKDEEEETERATRPKGQNYSCEGSTILKGRASTGSVLGSSVVKASADKVEMKSFADSKQSRQYNRSVMNHYYVECLKGFS